MTINNFLDFSSADDQIDLDEQEIAPSAHEVKSRLLDQLPNVLNYLFPEGKEKQKQFVVGDIDGNRGKSLVVELHGSKAGVWHDFATNESGDIFDLWAHHKGFDIRRDFARVIESASQWLGNVPAFQSAPKRKKSPPMDDLGPVTAKWDYHDTTGHLVVRVDRFDPPSGKVFRPWDVKARKHQAPKIRPLYQQPAIAVNDTIIFVEGEKCADALISTGNIATTAMGGANTLVDKTDWSPLKNKHVLIWPDNDEAGSTYAKNVSQAIVAAGAASVSILEIPKDKPKKWDAADAISEGVDVNEFIKSCRFIEVKKKMASLQLTDWHASDRFKGEPKARDWLIEHIFPLAQVSLLAASGGVGKSFLLAQLAREVAAFNGLRFNAPTLFGGDLMRKGASVYITAEDDAIEIHLRLNTLGDIPHHLYAVPLPDAGGVIPLFVPDPVKRMPTATAAWLSLFRQCETIADLRVIIFDPLQPLCALDLNIPENAQFVCSQLATLAAQTGAAVIVSHHFAKREATTPEQAREAIRGSGGLVDGVRCAYALWQPPQDKAEAICKIIKEKYSRGSVVFGGVVKSNGRSNLSVTTFIRDHESGILMDRTREIAGKRAPTPEDLTPFVDAIAKAAKEGKPYTKTGVNGVYERRFELPETFHQIGKHKFVRWVEQLQAEKKLVAAMAPGQTSVKWLDHPLGPVALGDAEFMPGHINRSISKRGKKGYLQQVNEQKTTRH
ncbi:AAA family ATPase [Agarilytica rhodophyticola]|uniref:AAA family ATPase n=1 Tax=Agarilytica rhodophyticola TaxID=1737490 RepID=UPI000CD98642|nr:AAA family ATPase [Agarilytica rhodophyticola]